MHKSESHGQYPLAIEGRFLVSRVMGPFNIECTRDYMHAMAPYAQQMAEGGPWGGIPEYSGSVLCAMECSDYTRKHIAIGVDRLRLVAIAWVVPPEVEGHGIVYLQAHPVFQDILPFQVFDDGESVRRWVTHQWALYTARKQ